MESKEYKDMSEVRSFTIRESAAAYVSSTKVEESVRILSMEQALRNGMPLEVSRSLLVERMRKDFPDIDF